MKLLMISILLSSALVFGQSSTTLVEKDAALVMAAEKDGPKFIPSPEPLPWDPPQFLKDVMLKAESIPLIGKPLLSVFKWLGVLSSVLTALVMAFFSITITLSRAFNLVGLVNLATKIDGVYLKIVPYLKYLSVFNAQKEEFKKNV
jgi:hypothetical protein